MKKFIFIFLVILPIVFADSGIKLGFNTTDKGYLELNSYDYIAYLNKDNIFTGNNLFYNLSALNVTIINYSIMDINGSICLNNTCIYGWSEINSTMSDYWDGLDTPADINAGDITDDGTYWNECSDASGCGYLTSESDTFDDVTGRGSYTSHDISTHDILPNATLTYDLGSPAYRWNNTYIGYLSGDDAEFSNDVTVMGTIWADTINASNLNLTSIHVKDIWVINTVADGNVTAGGYFIGDGSLLRNVNETDTLQTVTDRGSSTNNSITAYNFTGGTSKFSSGSYQAVLGDEINTRAGYFNGAGNICEIGTSSYSFNCVGYALLTGDLDLSSTGSITNCAAAYCDYLYGTAANADYAYTADYALQCDVATYADEAGFCTIADYASSAGTCLFADDATHATNCDIASIANSAYQADTAYNLTVTPDYWIAATGPWVVNGRMDFLDSIGLKDQVYIFFGTGDDVQSYYQAANDRFYVGSNTGTTHYNITNFADVSIDSETTIDDNLYVNGYINGTEVCDTDDDVCLADVTSVTNLSLYAVKNGWNDMNGTIFMGEDTTTGVHYYFNESRGFMMDYVMDAFPGGCDAFGACIHDYIWINSSGVNAENNNYPTNTLTFTGFGSISATTGVFSNLAANSFYLGDNKRIYFDGLTQNYMYYDAKQSVKLKLNSSTVFNVTGDILARNITSNDSITAGNIDIIGHQDGTVLSRQNMYNDTIGIIVYNDTVDQEIQIIIGDISDYVS